MLAGDGFQVREAAVDFQRRLNTNFGARLKGTPDAGLFAVLVQPIEMHGLAFRDAAARIAGVDTLKSFMRDFQKKFSVPMTGKAS